MLGDDVKFSTVYCVCRLYGLRLQGWYVRCCAGSMEKGCVEETFVLCGRLFPRKMCIYRIRKVWGSSVVA
jgi:hypothetical protein